MTKRFANALSKAGGLSPRSRFVIPDPGGEPYFIELETGRRHDQAAVVFVGRNLTAEDVLRKLKAPGVKREAAREVIERFLRQLEECALGSVISVQSGSDGSEVSVEEATARGPMRRPPLPG